MIRVFVEGHNNYYGISDLLRAFYGRTVENRDDHFVFCESGPDIDIVSLVKDGMIRTFIKGKEDLWVKEYEDIFGDRGLEEKREVKRQLYFLLFKIENRSFPWGSLTGIRPTIVAREEKTSRNLQERYMVRADKADLCIKTSENEERILETQGAGDMNVYIGVPFCPSRCAYCSFISKDITHHMKLLPSYADSLAREIATIGPKLSCVSAIYMGGGTPTVFDGRDFRKVLESMAMNIGYDKGCEITVEAGRPDTIDQYKLETMRELGIKRICINPQTMSDETLKRYNRRHTVQDTVKVYEMARKLGFDTINMDLIAGLNPEEPEELLYSLERLFELGPENITIHTLYKKRASNLTRQGVLGGEAAADGLMDDRLDRVLTKAYEMVEAKGYEPYYMYRQKDTSHGLENVGFALKGTECLYNVSMMSDRRNVISFGAGGMSKRIFDNGRLERFPTNKDVICYMRDLERICEDKAGFFGLD